MRKRITYAYSVVAIADDGTEHSISTEIANFGDACVVAMNVSKLPGVRRVGLATYQRPHFDERVPTNHYVKGHKVYS